MLGGLVGGGNGGRETAKEKESEQCARQSFGSLLAINVGDLNFLPSQNPESERVDSTAKATRDRTKT